MNVKTKESKFLDAINKYAENQKAQINKEIEDYKNSRIEQATEQGLKDAYDLIKSDIAGRKAAIVNETAKKELDIRKELFKYRQGICDEVFKSAEEKLREFVSSDEYDGYLIKQAAKTAELFGDEKCVVYLSPSDSGKQSVISKIIPNAEFKTDSHITIGGLRAYCRALGVTSDCTLDTALNDQRGWFTENSGLKVV